MTDLEARVEALLDEASQARQRRLLVIHGDREATYAAARRVVALLAEKRGEGVLVGEAAIGDLERVPVRDADELLGTTQPFVVYDAHDEGSPNALGRTVGTVDAGGLYVLLASELGAWPEEVDAFDESLAVASFEAVEVTGHFRRRFVETLRSLSGIAVYDANEKRFDRSGPMDVDAASRSTPTTPRDARFPAIAYERCLTRDQSQALAALESLLDPGRAVVLEADRGRGKSSAAGLAAGSLAVQGNSVLVTARSLDSASEVFARCGELASELGLAPAGSVGELELGEGGVRFAKPAEAIEAASNADVLVVDEAAALPVHVLEDLLATGTSVVFATTIHGYEGASRGFSVRFKDRLEDSDREVREVQLSEPIRYARGDPVEAWSFHALMLDARPPVAGLVEKASLDSVTYRRLTSDELVDEERLLRDVFGLLVLAHYQTEPDDLARLLDAPNIQVRALTQDGHVVSVALLAREGGLGPELRSHAYEVGRIRGHLLPDVLMSQLRDEEAGEPVGYRVQRIATHPAVQDQGFGSQLLSRIEEETDADWLGVGFGATPELVRFWRENGYRAVHLSTSRNDASGEHSALMLNAQSPVGRELENRSVAWFRRRVISSLSDPLSETDVDVVREVLASIQRAPVPELSEREWRLVASAAYGPGLFDVHPGCFRRVALAHLIDQEAEVSQRGERLLVAKALQARAWDAVADSLGFPSTRMARKALGRAFQPLVDRYGEENAQAEADRFGRD